MSCEETRSQKMSECGRKEEEQPASPPNRSVSGSSDSASDSRPDSLSHEYSHPSDGPGSSDRPAPPHEPSDDEWKQLESELEMRFSELRVEEQPESPPDRPISATAGRTDSHPTDQPGSSEAQFQRWLQRPSCGYYAGIANSPDWPEMRSKSLSIPKKRMGGIKAKPKSVPLFVGGNKRGAAPTRIRSFTSRVSKLFSKSSPHQASVNPESMEGPMEEPIAAGVNFVLKAPLALKAAKLESSGDETDGMKGPSRFIPDVLNERGNISYRFSIPGPGVFQCDLTKLRFTMTRDGELSYRVIQWDEDLLLSSGKTPAGLLFNIKCSEDAVSQLHFPHCEKELDPFSEGLSVVHISDDGMNILEPQEITRTHVVVDVPHLSAFGLVWEIIKRLLNIGKPIIGQVLLFHQPTYTRKSRKLYVFLLPDNVPVREVKGQQEEAEYIVTPSTCDLIRGQTYSLECSEAYRVQPASAPFNFKYGPNYHPTFEILIKASKEGATVIVRDQEKRSIWEYYIELTGLKPASSSTSPSIEPPTGEPALPPVEEDLQDVLLQKRVINNRELESIPAIPRADKARELIDMVLRKGNGACGLLIDTFCEVDPFLSAQLDLK
ncbi:caspase recruitment domain-containing protein 8-like isoform X2 [Trachinotus anak]|uniref:caspase recruitment domain-containing protein 8-like isoform X2 n=1 Tax=Trachinotus anak TaxID=443729 RepID=UPI0039F1F055